MIRLISGLLLLVTATACSQGGDSQTADSAPPQITAEHNGIWLAGQPSAADIQAWADAGRTVIINIRPDDEVAELPFQEDVAALGAGMTYVQFGVGGSDGFSRSMTSTFTFQMSMNEGAGLVLHSATGRRAAYLYAAHLIETGQVTPEEVDSLGLAPDGNLDPAVMRQLSPQYAEAFPE